MRNYSRITRYLLYIGFLMVFAIGGINTGEQVLAAVVANKTETVTFDPQGGSVNTTEKTVTVGSTYGILPVPTKENYTFRGWYIYSSGGTKINAEKKVAIASDHTLYAQWNGKDYTISLDAAGGTLETTKVTVRYGTKYLMQLPKPVRENYTFTGWYTQKSGGDKITSSTIYQDNPPKKLYAVWEKKILTVQFIGFNGDTYEINVICGSTFGTLPKPVRTGFTFNGWYTWGDYTDSTSTPITSTTKVTETSPLMLFARWY